MSQQVIYDIRKVIESLRDPDSETPDAPYYMHGHTLEIANRLMLKDKNKDEKNKKYPLIALREDIAERREGDMIHYRLNIAFLVLSKMNYISTERYENSFNPVLQPLYEDFLKALITTHIFTWPAQYRYPLHTKINRLYIGTEQIDKNVSHKFNDPIDAIEILDLQLIKRVKNC